MKPGSAWWEREIWKTQSRVSGVVLPLYRCTQDTQHINSRARLWGDWCGGGDGTGAGRLRRHKWGNSLEIWPGKILFKRVIWALHQNQGEMPAQMFVRCWVSLTNCLKSENPTSLFNIFCLLKKIKKKKSLNYILEPQLKYSGIICCQLTRACHCCCKITAWLSVVGSLCCTHSLVSGALSRLPLKWTCAVTQWWVKVSWHLFLREWNDKKTLSSYWDNSQARAGYSFSVQVKRQFYNVNSLYLKNNERNLGDLYWDISSCT